MVVFHMLRRRRRELEISQGELARRVGVHLNTVYRIEHGLTHPTLPLAVKFAEALGTTPAAIFPELVAASSPDNPTAAA